MVRFLRMGLVFTLVVVVLYIAVMVVLCRLAPGGVPLIHRTGDYYHLKGGVSYAKFREWDPAAHHDVLVVGSSHAYRGYDPRIFADRGLSLFNLGSSAQTPLNTLHVLRGYAGQGRAGLVLIDVYEGALTNDGLESTSDLVMNIGSDRAAAGMAWDQADLRAVNMLALRFLRRDAPADVIDSTYVPGGFSQNTDSLKGAVPYARFDRSKVRADQLVHLAACLDHCRDRGLPAVLVSHPQPHAADSVGHLVFRALIDSVRAPYGTPYLDLALGHALDDHDHFYDHNHLNQAGVERFNAILISALDSTGLLPRRRGTP
jgi:hypothetical protein